MSETALIIAHCYKYQSIITDVVLYVVFDGVTHTFLNIYTKQLFVELFLFLRGL